MVFIVGVSTIVMLICFDRLKLLGILDSTCLFISHARFMTILITAVVMSIVMNLACEITNKSEPSIKDITNDAVSSQNIKEY